MKVAAFLVSILLAITGLAQTDVVIDQPESYLVEHWDGSSWSIHNREVYTYTTSGQPSDTTRSANISGTWYNDWRSRVAYDEHGRRIELLRQLGMESDWDDQWRWAYEYDELDRLSLSIFFDYKNEIWESKRRHHHHYDEFGRLADETTEFFAMGDWWPDTRRAMTYNPAHLLIEIRHQRYDFDNDIWENREREEFEYDSQGRNTLRLYQLLESSEWLNEEQTLWDYDGEGTLLTETTQWWVSEGWLNVDRLVYSFTPEEILLSVTTQDWNYDETFWYDDYQEAFSYDEHGRQIEVLSGKWDSDSSAWINDVRQTWSYSPTSIIHPIQPAIFTLEQNHPNPFNPSTTIRFSLEKAAHVELAVFNMRGEKVTHLVNGELDRGQNAVLWNGLGSDGHVLSSGVYICRLITEGQSQSLRMLLLR